MKTDFSVNIHVDLGVTPEVVALVTAIIGHKQMPMVQQPSASEQPEPAPTPAKRGRGRKAATTEAPADNAKAAPADVDANEQAPTQTVTEPQPEAEQAPEPEQPKELTEQDIREAMHRTRQRIEGENYKDETDSEAYTKYHRQLTANFKNIAALLGADKPSALPADKRASFIAQCDELQVLEDGTIGTKCPY